MGIHIRAENSSDQDVAALSVYCTTDCRIPGNLAWRPTIFTLRTVLAPWDQLWNSGLSLYKTGVRKEATTSGETTLSTSSGGKKVIALVTFTLNPKRSIPDGFFEELKKQGNGWAHYFDEIWAISTMETPDQLYERLRRHLNILEKGGDYLLVATITDDYSGWMPQDFWTWLQEERDKGY